MALGHYDELLNSLKRLYLDPEFSDLSIVSTCKTYPVHKAVVCPRSPYLAEKCRSPAFTASGNTIEVTEDDPQAVHLVVEYLYNLDYSDTLPDELLRSVSPDCHENGSLVLGFTADSPVVVTNGFDHGPGGTDGPPTEDALAICASPQAETESPVLVAAETTEETTPTSKKGKKGKKSKKSRKSIEDPEHAPVDDMGAQQPIAETPELPAETPAGGSSRNPPQLEPPQEKLTTHAKLYSLSAKYGISELRTLALNKFQNQAQNGWDDNDFVRAAGEVYASPLLGQDNHTDIRRAVTGLVFSHGELLDKVEMRDILRGDLALDLIMRFREEGVW